VARQTRIRAFGSCAILVLAGVFCAVFIGGRTGTVLTIAFMLAGLGGALLLVFFEVGLSEDHEREREEAQRRNRAEARRRPQGPRWPRRPG
jgi:fatty acid desaturase